jgi:hypothetical protein
MKEYIYILCRDVSDSGTLNLSHSHAFVLRPTGSCVHTAMITHPDLAQSCRTMDTFYIFDVCDVLFR